MVSAKLLIPSVLIEHLTGSKSPIQIGIFFKDIECYLK